MYVLGLTGGLSSGKTTVLRLFRKKGAETLDADQIAHAFLADEECLREIIKEFGEGILKGQKIDRRKLATVVFDDREKLKALEDIIHPKVRDKIVKRIKELKAKKDSAVLVVEVPLLFEAGYDKIVDKTVVVKVDRKTQLARAIKHLGINEREAGRRIKNQMPLKEKIRLADFIIDNSKEINLTKVQVDILWQKLQ